MEDITLKAYQFCGGDAELVKKEIYLDYGYRVDCTRCGAKGPFVMVNRPKMTYRGLDESTRYSRDQAIIKASEAWNRRSNGRRR